MRQPFMGGMLVYEHQIAVAGNGDDIGIEHLSHRRPERKALGFCDWLCRCEISRDRPAGKCELHIGKATLSRQWLRRIPLLARRLRWQRGRHRGANDRRWRGKPSACG